MQDRLNIKHIEYFSIVKDNALKFVKSLLSEKINDKLIPTGPLSDHSG